MISRIEYLGKVFSQISHSFSLSSRLLPTDIRRVNTVLYLMARIADTIEDCNLSIEEKKKYFKIYKEILDNGKETGITTLLDMLKAEHANFSNPEFNLIANIPSVINELESLKSEEKNVIKDEVTTMMEGMEKFLERRIQTFDDQNEYCHYVAGTVGEALTTLYYINGHISAEAMILLNSSENFALALQKVNMIRGIRDDFKKKRIEEANRIYVPQELLDSHNVRMDDLFDLKFKNEALSVLNELVADSKRYFRDSLNYLTTIPQEEFGIRKFSSVILFISLSMLIKCRDNYAIFLNDDEIGLSFIDKMKVFRNSRMYAKDDSKLKRYHSRLIGSLN